MMNKNILVSLAACAALAGCGTLSQPQQGGAAVPTGTWFNPPSDYPGICMTFAKDGALRFDGGFAFFNPARWTYDDAAKELQIKLGGSGEFPAPLEPGMKKTNPQAPNQGDLLRFDATKRSFTYRVQQNTDAIDFGGFKFYRNRPCVADK
jgi:hypothetical protein